MPRKQVIIEWIGRLLIAVSLIAVPLSMSHASMLPVVSGHDVTPTMKHHEHHTMKMDHKLQQDNSLHDGHNSSDCCSAICGGALIVDIQLCNRLSVPFTNMAFSVQALATSKLMTPHRPPSI